MLSTHKLITTYNNFEIYQRLPGFEFTPIVLGKIASFIVKRKVTLSVFAFYYSLLDAMEDQNIQENELLEKAVKVIKHSINANTFKNSTDYTFEYKPQDFFVVKNPKWWINTFQ